jgi:parallel beta-helix repeat protein
MRRIMAVFTVFMVFTGALVISDLCFDSVIMNTQAATVYVGGTGPGNNTTIQEGINAANPGDTVFVYAGTYVESLVIDKTLTLMGEDKDTTIINATGNINGIQVSNADYVDISGFTIEKANAYNLKLTSSDNCYISDNILQNSGSSALGVFSGHDNLIEDNLITDNLQGVLITDHSNSNILRDNTITSIGDRAISIQGQSADNLISNNEITGYNLGFYIYESEDNRIENNQISNGGEGLRILVVDNITIQDNMISDNNYNLRFYSASATVVNCTLQNPNSYDIWVDDPDMVGSEITLINTSFDEDKVSILGDTIDLIVKEYLEIKVLDESDEPVSGITVRIKDKITGEFDEIYTTDTEGEVNWILLTQYQQNHTTKVDVPYNITAYSTTLRNYTPIEITLDTETDITIIAFSDLDGDGIFDVDDDFPNDSTQWSDSDGDGYGDNPSGNDPDVFPEDPDEWADSDGDEVGDNSDDFPDDPAASSDSDGDDRPEKWNPGRTKSDSTTGLELDEFPDDPDEWKDSDGDGVGDNSDFLPSLNNNVFIMIIILIIIIVIILVVLVKKKGKKQKVVEEKKEEKTRKPKKERPPPPPWVKKGESVEKKEVEEDEEEGGAEEDMDDEEEQDEEKEEKEDEEEE